MVNQTNQPWWSSILKYFGEITVWVAGPVIAALFLGRWLDEKYQTKPWFFLGLTFIAFAVTCIGLVLFTNRYIRQLENKGKEKDESRRSSHFNKPRTE